jgi:hypothetical protein
MPGGCSFGFGRCGTDRSREDFFVAFADSKNHDLIACTDPLPRVRVASRRAAEVDDR